MLKQLLRAPTNSMSRSIARSFSTIKQRGNFELSYEVPPRYFMLTYQLKAKNLEEAQKML